MESTDSPLPDSQRAAAAAARAGGESAGADDAEDESEKDRASGEAAGAGGRVQDQDRARHETAKAKPQKTTTKTTAKTATKTPTKTPRPAAGAPKRWRWPAQGELVGKFSRSGGQNGIRIAGKAGSPVRATAAGEVVYAGDGLRGYGNLIIIEHSPAYLSAYAHNRKLLVREGARIKSGQRIAQMGDSGADRVMLHFEIRRRGKPVDPLKFLK